MGTGLKDTTLESDGASGDNKSKSKINHGWEKLLGTLFFLGGLGFDVAGTDLSVVVPVGLEKVAVVLGLIILARMAKVDLRTVAAFAVVALGVWVWGWLNPPGEHTLYANLANLREEPGLEAPRQLRLVDRSGEKISVDESSDTDGWFLIKTDAGEEGWLFGAFIRGLDDYNVGETKDGSSAILLDANGDPTGEVNRSTNRVLITERSDDLFEVLTASGTTRWVAVDDIFDFS